MSLAPTGTPPAHGPVHLTAGGVSVVVTATGDRMPRILHWGAALGDLTDDDVAALDRARRCELGSSAPDVEVEVGVVPEASAGWQGTPGLEGHRSGNKDVTTRFLVTALDRRDGAATWTMTDADAGLALRYELELAPSGLLRHRATVRNDGETDFGVDALRVAFPVPAEAGEVLDLTGRHLRERSPQRHALTCGGHVREGRRGRTGFDAPLVHAAGTPGFSWRDGEVWGQHVAWSGGWRSQVERDADGVTLLVGGEQLLSGEIRLRPGDEYDGPWVYLSYGRGLDELAGRFHAYLRARPQHPRRPRPVTLNVWEAVYFDHRLDRLLALAEEAAAVGVERFVLDDGWFGSRRDDTSGLGDWVVSPDAWPDGLAPLATRVRELGMELGLWVEPEMVNLDSDLARAHPEWVLGPAHRRPVEARHQQVLDLAAPGASDHLFERLSALVTEHDLAYLKWDHNRDLVEPVHQATGRAALHDQTRATYALLDRLRAAHPGLEIESCSSGGARVDLGILERTDRVWGSDCIDPLERQHLQRWTSLLLPPELVGSHVGSERSHTTGRRHDLAFRAGTALLGHLGTEWDLTTATADDKAGLARWVQAYKDLRPLLHTGRLVHGDHPDPSLLVTGVVAADGSRAVYELAQVATSVTSRAGLVRLPGLDPDARYRVRPLPPGDVARGPVRGDVGWWRGGTEASGAVLGRAGIVAPTLYPESLVLVEAVRV